MTESTTAGGVKKPLHEHVGEFGRQFRDFVLALWSSQGRTTFNQSGGAGQRPANFIETAVLQPIVRQGTVAPGIACTDSDQQSSKEQHSGGQQVQPARRLVLTHLRHQ